MSITARIENVVKTFAERRAEAVARRALDEKLSAYATPRDLMELEAIVARYPEEQTAEMRDALHRLAVKAA